MPSAGPVSNARATLAKVVVALMVVLVAVGLAQYGFSSEVRARIWHNLIERPHGPMTFRFVLQPVMATIAAFYDARRDARAGRSPYLWTILSKPHESAERLGEGIVATARVILLGLCMDLIYQVVEFRDFFPAEAVIVALLLAFVPYLLLRGPLARIVHWWRSDARRSEIP